MSRLTDQTLFENQLYVCLQSWKTECIVNRCKKNNKVICMLCHSLQFVSCTVRHVFLVPRTSSGVDYVLVIELSANGLEPTFFFFGGGGAGGNRVQDHVHVGCDHVHGYVVCGCVSAGMLCEMNCVRMCICVLCYVCMSVHGVCVSERGRYVVWDEELRRKNLFKLWMVSPEMCIVKKLML